MATMTQYSVLALATLVGAGIAGAAAVLNSQDTGDAPLAPGGAHTTISSEAAVAWQALRRPRPADPAPQQQPQELAVVRIDNFRTSPSVGPLPGSPLDTFSLTRALQRELKRAGCYHGEINGIWTPSTRQAMKTYTDIANARLPVTNPDPVLLALLRGDQHLGCAARCLRNGKPSTCREDGVMASSPASNRSAAAREEPTFQEPPMALAGPKTSAADGEVAASKKPVQKANKRYNIDRSRTEHWSVKLWRDSAN